MPFSHKSHVCDICQKSYKHKKDLNYHLRTHTKEKPYVCDICLKCFIRKKSLKLHSLTHSQEKPHICDICQKCFSRKSYLTNHLLIHWNEKPYACVICQKKFSSKNHLKSHLLTYTQEKPYACDICQKCFNHKSTLKNHLLSHTQEKLHACDICKRCFGRKSHLKKHVLTHSQEKQHGDQLELTKLEEICFNNEEDFYLNEERMEAVLLRVKDGNVGDSMFVKNLACAVFGTDVLIRSSVTGGKCNAKKESVAKPALCPKRLTYIKKLFIKRLKKEMCSHDEMLKRLSKMNSFIAEKIITLIRKK